MSDDKPNNNETGEAVSGGIMIVVLILWAFDLFFFTESGCIEASPKWNNKEQRAFYCQKLGSENLHVWIKK